MRLTMINLRLDNIKTSNKVNNQKFLKVGGSFPHVQNTFRDNFAVKALSLF